MPSDIPNNIPTQEENPTGLHGRYYVEKVSGEPMDARAEYFILRLDPYGTDINHIRAGRKAMLVYAEAIRPFIPNLAEDIIRMWGEPL